MWPFQFCSGYDQHVELDIIIFDTCTYLPLTTQPAPMTTSTHEGLELIIMPVAVQSTLTVPVVGLVHYKFNF